MSRLYHSLRRKGKPKMKAFKETGIAKRLSIGRLKSKGKCVKRHYPYSDWDGDGKVNKYDCKPYDKNKQELYLGKMSGKNWLAKTYADDPENVYIGNSPETDENAWARIIAHEELHNILKREVGDRASNDLDIISEPALVDKNRRILNKDTINKIYTTPSKMIKGLFEAKKRSGSSEEEKDRFIKYMIEDNARLRAKRYAGKWLSPDDLDYYFVEIMKKRPLKYRDDDNE